MYLYYWDAYSIILNHFYQFATVYEGWKVPYVDNAILTIGQVSKYLKTWPCNITPHLGYILNNILS